MSRRRVRRKRRGGWLGDLLRDIVGGLVDKLTES